MRDHTIVFDLDGTLVDTAPDLVAAANHALADLGLAPVSSGALSLYVSHGARRMLVEALRLSGRELPDDEIDRLLAMFLVHYEANIARESRPYEGVVEALRDFKEAGARLAVCTNKRESLSVKLLRELGLAPCFDAIAGRDTFPVSKPHPDHLRGAIALAGGSPDQAVMVGDTHVDVETARRAAIPSVAVTFGYSDVPVSELGASLTIRHYRELFGAIEMLRSRFNGPARF